MVYVQYYIVMCCVLKAFNADDSIRWLNKLLLETSCEPNCSSSVDDDDDDIYDDIYNWAVYQSNGRWSVWRCFLTYHVNMQQTTSVLLTAVLTEVCHVLDYIV